MQRLCSTHQYTNDRGSQSALEPKTKSKFLSPWFCSWIFSADQCLSFTFHDYFPWCQFFFNYTNTIFVLYFEFVWWGGLTLQANLLKGPAFHFSDHYMEKLLLIWLESLSDLEYASLWEFKQMKTIYFNSEFSAEVFSFLTTRNSFRTRTFLKCLSRKLITILTSLPPAFFTHEWHYTWHQMFCCWLNFNPYWKSHALKSKRRKYQKNAFRFFLPLPILILHS